MLKHNLFRGAAVFAALVAVSACGTTSQKQPKLRFAIKGGALEAERAAAQKELDAACKQQTKIGDAGFERWTCPNKIRLVRGLKNRDTVAGEQDYYLGKMAKAMMKIGFKRLEPRTTPPLTIGGTSHPTAAVALIPDPNEKNQFLKQKPRLFQVTRHGDMRFTCLSEDKDKETCRKLIKALVMARPN